MYKTRALVVFLLLSAVYTLHSTSYDHYTYNPLVPITIWNELEPFFLPYHHPIRPKLDRLFSCPYVMHNQKTFEQVFGVCKKRPSGLIAIRSDKLKGYILKVFLDDQTEICEWKHWIRRIRGAEQIGACIERHGFTEFCVPCKWIYPLPLAHKPNRARKNFILVVEDMQILASKSNLKAFREQMTEEILSHLYLILTEEGLIDSVYPDNIPFTHSGKIAFIDTEHWHCAQDIPYKKLLCYLSVNKQTYWRALYQR